jgi:hypothetical protein
VSDSIVTVKADIPEAAEAQSVALFVDGVEVATHTDGAPWEISWPSYYWADGGAHTLLLKTVTGGGNEVRNNQQFQVTVDVAANKLLEFATGTAGVVIKDENSLPIEFDEFPGATQYELRYSSQNAVNVVETLSSGVELTDLEVGAYELSYRAIMAYSALTTLEGPWSNSVTFEVSPPNLPNLNPPELTASGEGYDVVLSWEDLGEGNTYKIQLDSLADNSAPTAYDDITKNEFLISSLPIGEYQWSLTRTNPLGHESLPSDTESIEAGAFTKYYGGTSDDRAQKIIHSRDGGYIVLAETKSYEVSDTVDAQGDDWIFKIDNQGDIEWQYVSSAIGIPRFHDIIELADGSIVVVGSDWSSDKALALKLDENGTSVWEVTFSPDGVTDRYGFRNIVEFNGSLHVSGEHSEQWGPESCNGECPTTTGFYLHTLSLSDGAVSDKIDIPSIAGLSIIGVRDLLPTSSGNLVISGTARPEGINVERRENGAFLQVVAPDLAQVSTWSDAGTYTKSHARDVIELSNGNFAVVGARPLDGLPGISVIDSNGSQLEEFSIEYGQGYGYFWNDSIIARDNGGFYVLFISGDYGESSGKGLTFMKLNSSATLESQSTSWGYKDYLSTHGLLRNNDGTFTALFNEGQNEYSNYDIGVVRLLID